MDVALTEPPFVRLVWREPSERLDGRWDCSPKAAATASQLGCTFSTARMVRNSFASFSAVQSMAFWPVGIFEILVGWMRLVIKGLGTMLMGLEERKM